MENKSHYISIIYRFNPLNLTIENLPLQTNGPTFVFDCQDQMQMTVKETSEQVYIHESLGTKKTNLHFFVGNG